MVLDFLLLQEKVLLVGVPPLTGRGRITSDTDATA